jgi:uncharacterized protein
MSEHPNAARIKGGYTAFANGDFAALDDLFAEDLLWHVSGRNQLSGEYRGRDAVYGFFGRLMEVTEGSFHLDVHAVLADDAHGVALVATTGSRAGRNIATNDAHVFHMRDGKVTEFWDSSTDQYATDELIG